MYTTLQLKKKKEWGGEKSKTDWEEFRKQAAALALYKMDLCYSPKSYNLFTAQIQPGIAWK